MNDPIFTPLFILYTGGGLSAFFGGSLTALGTLGAAAGAVGGLAGGALSSVAAGIVTVGIGLLLQPDPPAPENGQVAIQQAVAPRIYAYGTCRLAGYVALLETSSGVLNHVAALCGHRIAGITGYYLNDDAVTVATDGTFQVNGLDDGRYQACVTIQNRLGAIPGVPYSSLIGALPDMWDTNHRGDGIATLYMQCTPVASTSFQTAYPFGRPQPSIIANTAMVFDPRDNTQTVSDPTTWKFSRNVALCILHFECFNQYGPLRPYATAILPVLSEWINAANACDDLVALKAGGTEARYACGFWTTTEQDKRSTRQTLLAACDGWFAERGDGTVVLKVGKFELPYVTLTEDDIAGYSIQTGLPDQQRANRITATYTFPANGYATTDTQALEDTVDQAARGKILPSRLQLVGVQSNGQASRLTKRELIRQQAGARGQLQLRLSGMAALYERWIAIDAPSIPLLHGKVVENRKPVLSLLSASCTLDFVQVGAEIETYNPATDESPAPTVPTRSTTTGSPVPANVSVIPTNVGGSVYLVVSWDAPINTLTGAVADYLSYIIQYRTHPSGSPAGNWVQQTVDNPTINAGRVTATTVPVPVGTTLDLEVASKGLTTPSAFSTPLVTVSTAIPGVAPGMPTNLTATGSSGSASLSAKNPNSPNFSYLQFYRSAHGAAFSTATPVGSPIYGSANGTSTYTDTVTAGTYDYWAEAFNSTGTGSTAAGPATATVT